MPLKQASNFVFASMAALVLAACGGGDGSSAVNQAPGSYTVEAGLAQKGPLMQGSQITINELSFSNFQPSGRSFDFEVTNNLGTFNPSGISFSSPYLSTTAEGYYFNELTGLPSTDMVFLRGLSDVYVGGDTTINVNVLSNFSKNRILNLATGKNLLNPATGAAASAAPMQFLKARAQAQAENLKAFYIYNSASILSGTTVGGVAQPANFTALDLGKSSVPVSGPCANGVCSNVVALVPIAGNQILAAVSALVMKAGTDGDGVNTLLSQIEADFADDGLLNNSPKYAQSVKSRLCAAAASTDFAKVATNLNAFYGTNYQATDLSQWVDTSRCVDQVIDKYKVAASNVAVGTVSKATSYLAGADDIGQCFSVGGTTAGATAVLYYNGAATAVSGTQLVKAGDAVTIGINASTTGSYSGFIQRSAPGANGVCPTAVPNSGVIRVQKYSISTSGSTPSTYSLGGTVIGLASGQSLALQNNATNSTSVITNGAFTFSNAMASGAAYSVTVTTQPIGQTCTVANGNGTMSASVSNVVVSCDSSTVTLFVSTLAGTGQKGYADGPGTTATFDFAPFSESLGLAIDSKNYLYLADTWNHKIRKISMATGVVSTVAGSGLDAELDGTATTAAFSHASGIAIDAMDNIYVTDYSSIRKISAVNGAVTTLAGGGSCTDLICGVDGIGNKASFRMARGIAIDKLGNLYVADTGNHKIRKVSSTGVVSTFAGSGLHGSSDGVGAAASFYSPTGLTIGSDGSLFVSDFVTRLIRKISPSGVVTTLAGAPGEYTCASGTSQSPVFGGPSGIAVNTAGTIYVADEACGKVFSISPSGAVSIYAGGGVSDSDGPALTAGFSGPGGIILDQKNNIYVINSYIPKIKLISKK